MFKIQECLLKSNCTYTFLQIIYTVCERLLELAKKGSSLQKQLEKNQKSHTDLKTTFSTISQNSTMTLDSKFPVQSASKDSLLEQKKRKKKSLLARTRQRSVSMEDLEDEKFKSVLDERESECQSVTSSNSGLITPGVDDDDDDNSIVFGNSVTDLQAACNTSGGNKPNSGTNTRDVGHKSNDRRHSPHHDIPSRSETETTDWSIDQSVSTIEMSEECVQKVAYSLSADKTDDYVRERAAKYEVRMQLLE